MTRREEVHQEMKREIRQFAERICNLLDHYEAAVTIMERNSQALVEKIEDEELMVQ